ncbi:unnamed protein product [Phyllotreta striolata]|uniref:endo-polygalacturonase n=1 Tax=Phyllotreta striolata TaxID=444603 RepID=A0A9N9XK21_PHYSR|nr:unnamed protein product [Phyllotreta striolata]
MKSFHAILTIIVITSSAKFAQSLNCTINEFDQLKNITQSCRNIVISNLVVPAAKSLELSLLPKTTLDFQGRITFEYSAWNGPLVTILGESLTIRGSPESVLDGQGQLYWDGKGGNGGKPKPVFMRIKAQNSLFENIKILNCPVRCVSISHSSNTKIRYWTIDVSDGDKNNFTGHNTDGFDLGSNNNLVIEHSVVKNQDDCVVVNKGSNILIQNMTCSGGHGLSLSVGSSLNNFEDNTVYNVTFRDSIIRQSANGIHLKTHCNSGKGLIRNITYENIRLIDITNFGINVQQNYANGEATDKPKGNIPIVDFHLRNITGNMKSFMNSPTISANIVCGIGGCSDWLWNGVVINGAQNASICNFEPTGYKCNENM